MFDLQPYRPDDRASWDRFIRNAANGTLFHRLDFLSYHGDRFADEEHHVLWRKGDEIVAALPLAMRTEGGVSTARSPYGASWGGLVHASKFSLENAVHAVGSLTAYLSDAGVSACSITMPPPYCWYEYTNYVEFALAHHGFTAENPELTHVIVIPPGASAMDVHTSSARTQIRKAMKLGVCIRRDVEIASVYSLLQENRTRVGGEMTHSLSELERVAGMHEAYVKADAAWYDGRIIAANVYLNTGRALLSFYPSFDAAYSRTGALSYLIHDAVAWSIEEGLTCVDLGCSTYRTQIPNAGVARFKENLGARGLFRTTYKWIGPNA